MDFLGAIGTAIGGLLGRQSQKSDNALAREQAEINAVRNIELQKEFAKSGVQWRVEDARKAGIHPMFALGASTQSFAPVSVGSSASSFNPAVGANMGQSIGRALSATQDTGGRLSMVSEAAQGLQLENMHLQNQLLASQVRRMNSQVGPAMPTASGDNYLVEGQGDVQVKSDTFKRIPGAAGQPQSEPGAITDVGYARTATGWAPIPSKDVKERIEDMNIQEAMWALRNNVLPTLGVNRSPPPFEAPAGQHWWFNAAKQEYQLVKDEGFWGFMTKPRSFNFGRR